MGKNILKNNKILGSRQFYLALIDLGCFLLSYIAYILLFTTEFIPDVNFGFWLVFINFLFFAIAITSTNVVFGTYANVWRYATFTIYLKLIFADILGGAFALAISAIFNVYIGIWGSISVVLISTLLKLSARMLYQYDSQRKEHSQQKDFSYVAIVGAGNIGTNLARELLFNKRSKYRPYCFIDISRHKVGQRIFNLKVLDGSSQKVLETIKKSPVKEIILAFAPQSSKIEKLYNFYSQLGIPVKVFDYPFSDGSRDTSKKRSVRDISIEDLLFRDPIKMNNKNLEEYYTGKTILVTGGGGSIGSELCRQIAKRNPKKLIILDIYENNAYEIQQELIRKYGNKLDLSVEIASVRDRDRLDKIFDFYRPNFIFHAAAHKHVPLMEHNPGEAIKNNCMGTFNVADMAEKYQAEKFILISTDKAVNPTNIMGATKRVCEMIVQSRFDSKTTSFAAVRFGNVLGSNGSVVPLFKKQIAEGGPLTITDKRIIRYFMTISEACQLVLHAGIQADRGELFVLDMGKPVKIIDLAENMIRLSGFTPYEDIDIKEIGLRPGEKLYEELLVKTDKTQITSHDMIFVEKDEPKTREKVNEKLQTLLLATKEGTDKDDMAAVRKALHEVVESFKEPDEINQKV